MTNTEKQLHKSMVNAVEQNEKCRVESGLLGELQVSAGAYYGAQTQRTINNYHISSTKICDYPQFIVAITYVKGAAAAASAELGTLDKSIAGHTCQAAGDIIGGKLQDNFCIDMVQGRAGTSVNMNANEVITNYVLELMGYEKSDYVHYYPNDHVNCGQFTNDAYPMSLRYVAYRMNKDLLKSLKALVDCLRVKVNKFKDAVKMGRTQLQDAVSMTSGQKFAAFANTLEDKLEYIEYSAKKLLAINIGATAIGTGLNAIPGYADLVTEYLTRFTGDKFVKVKNMIAATPDTGDYVSYSEALKRSAIKLSKICGDLRLMASDPRCGLYEINLPPMAPDSFITPGKANLVIPEVTNQVCLKVIGNDMIITMAAEAGQLRLNVVEPIIVECMFEGITRMTDIMNTSRGKYVNDIALSEKHNLGMVKHSIGVVTALNPYIGYKNSTKVAREALETGKSLREIVVEKNLMSAEKVDKILGPKAMLQSHDL